MVIREAKPDDNEALQELQAKCPQGTSVLVSIVNMPDFFARAKTYESHRVFVACADTGIIGSAAVGIREAIVNGETQRVGYEFQFFTSPDHQRKGVGRVLHRHIEDYLVRQKVVLSYLFVMEGNIAPQRLFECEGFRLHRTVAMPIILVYKKMDVSSKAKIRPITSRDLGTVARLMNETWKGYDFYEPKSAEGLAQFIDRTPAYTLDQLMVLENEGEILACLGFWDWSRIARITVRAVGRQLKIVGLMTTLLRRIWSMPRIPKAGTIMKQWCLTPIAYRAPEHLIPLIRYINNLAMNRGIEQIYFISERNDPLLRSLKGLFHRDVALHLYIKPLQKILVGANRVFLDGIDL
jgi:GNAT superfamily N-acetyltransferase